MAACSAANNGAGIITLVLTNVDSVGCNYVQTAYQGLSQSITSGAGTGVAGLLLTTYVIFWGYGIWSGTATGGPTDHAWRLLRVFAIYALATGWSDFQTLVYSALNDGPSAVGNSLLAAASVNAANLNSTSGVETALQSVWDTSVQTAIATINSFSVLNFGGYVIAGLLLAVMALFVGAAAFLIVLSKLFMWLLLALAPVFIFALLFGFSSRFFMGWASSLAQYFIVQILVYAFLAFYVSITQQVFTSATSAGPGGMTMTVLAPVLIVGVIGILLLAQIPNVAAGIAGGAPIANPGFGGLIAGGYARFMGVRGFVNSIRNPFNPASISRGERLMGARIARERGVAGAYASNSAFEARLKSQLANIGGT